jgi:hypothetical protein
MKEFIPFEEAVALKHLGFDYDCFSYLRHDETQGPIGLYYCYDQPEDLYVLQPTFQQAFSWFREYFWMHQQIEYVMAANRYDWWVGSFMGHSKTYEEAELASLRQLIKISKESI